MKKSVTAAVIIFVLSLAAYSNTFTASFQFNDFHQIVKNSHVHMLSEPGRFFTRGDAGSYKPGVKGYRPLTNISYAVNYAVSGEKTWSYHLLNFLLHTFNAFLIYLVAAAVLKKAGYVWARSSALVAALAFSLHPVQTGAVTYISGRPILLAAFFCLLSFYAFLRFREGQGRGHAWAAASAAFFFMALLSKETASAFVLIVLLHDFLFTAPGEGAKKAFGLYHLSLFAVIAFFLACKILAGGYGAQGSDFGLWNYAISQFSALFGYLGLLVFPAGQNADYNLPALAEMDMRAFGGVVFATLAVYYLFRVSPRRPAWTFFGLWSLFVLGSESGAFPATEVFSESRLYLASAGFLALGASLFTEFVNNGFARKVAAAVVIILLGTAAFARNGVWATEVTLWNDVVRKTPHSARAHASLGNALLGEGRYYEAIYELKLATAVDPDYRQAYNVHNNLAVCYSELGKDDEAARECMEAIRLEPGLAEPYVNLSEAYRKTGRHKEALGALLQARKINPEFRNLGLLLAREYAQLGMREEAAGELDAAAQAGFDNFQDSFFAAITYMRNGMPEQAGARAREALKLAEDGPQRQDAERFIARLAR